MAIVISDTSPIRALHHLNLLELLRELYGRVYLPEAVCRELRQTTRRFPAFEPSAYSFFIIESPRDLARVLALKEKLDAGEAAALALALERKADYVLIDEHDGRRVAKELGLNAIGVLGVLADAIELALIPLVAPLVQRLENEIDFYLAPSLVANVLRSVGEQDSTC